MRALHYKGWIIWMTQTKWAIDLPDPKKARNHINRRHHRQLFFSLFSPTMVGGREWVHSEPFVREAGLRHGGELLRVCSVTGEGGEDNTFLEIAAPMIRKTCQGLIAASWEATSCGLSPGRWIYFSFLPFAAPQTLPTLWRFLPGHLVIGSTISVSLCSKWQNWQKNLFPKHLCFSWIGHLGFVDGMEWKEVGGLAKSSPPSRFIAATTKEVWQIEGRGNSWNFCQCPLARSPPHPPPRTHN